MRSRREKKKNEKPVGEGKMKSAQERGKRESNERGKMKSARRGGE